MSGDTLKGRGVEATIAVGIVVAGLGAAAVFQAREHRIYKEALTQTLYEQDYLGEDGCLTEVDMYNPARGAQEIPSDYWGGYAIDAQAHGGGVLQFSVEEADGEYSLQPDPNSGVILRLHGCTVEAPIE